MKQQIDLDGPRGNAYFLLATAQNFMQQLGRDQDYVADILGDMKAGNYANLLEVFEAEFGEYIELVNKPEE